MNEDDNLALENIRALIAEARSEEVLARSAAIASTARADRLAEKIANLEQRLRSQRPAEPSGGLVTFSLRRRHTTYSYAALRVGDRWYTTGGTCPRGGYTWARLLDFIAEADWHGSINAHAFERILSPEDGFA